MKELEQLANNVRIKMQNSQLDYSLSCSIRDLLNKVDSLVAAKKALD